MWLCKHGLYISGCILKRIVTKQTGIENNITAKKTLEPHERFWQWVFEQFSFSYVLAQKAEDKIKQKHQHFSFVYVVCYKGCNCISVA